MGKFLLVHGRNSSLEEHLISGEKRDSDKDNVGQRMVIMNYNRMKIIFIQGKVFPPAQIHELVFG